MVVVVTVLLLVLLLLLLLPVVVAGEGCAVDEARYKVISSSSEMCLRISDLLLNLDATAAAVTLLLLLLLLLLRPFHAWTETKRGEKRWREDPCVLFCLATLLKRGMVFGYGKATDSSRMWYSI